MNRNQFVMICAAGLLLGAGYSVLTSYAVYDNALLRDGGAHETISTDVFASEDMTITLTKGSDVVDISVTVERDGILVVYETGSTRSYLSYGDGTMTDEVGPYALEDIRIRVYDSTGMWRSPSMIYSVKLPSSA